jgi:hypothetical protein
MITEYLSDHSGAHFTGLDYQTWDFTQDDYRLAQCRKAVLAELRPRFEAAGLLFVYENRLGDANGVSGAIESGQHGRYLYLVRADKKVVLQ